MGRCNMLDLISVVIPVYKAEKSIESCLNSVLRQTYSNLEILVVLLESEDNTKEILNSYHDNRLKIILQTEKNGPGGARNIGIDYASGQWLGFLEADDTIPLDFYEHLLKTAQQEKADIVCCPICLNDKLWESYSATASYYSLKDKYGLIQNGASFNKLFSLELIKNYNIKFSENKRWEDNLFIFKSFYYAKKIVATSQPVYFYNFSQKDDQYRANLKRDILPVTEEIMGFFQAIQINKDELLLAKKKIVCSYAQSFIEDGETYKQLMKLMDKPLFLRICHYKKKFKIFKHRFLHKKRKEN